MNKCDKCDKEFKSNRNLMLHNKKYPNCINKCPICLKKFSNNQSLKSMNW